MDMKRITKYATAVCLSIATICTACFLTGANIKGNTVNASKTVKVAVKGDLNGDGKFTLEDVTIALKLALGIIDKREASGTDRIKDIKLEDCTELLKAALGIISIDDVKLEYITGSPTITVNPTPKPDIPETPVRPPQSYMPGVTPDPIITPKPTPTPDPQEITEYAEIYTQLIEAFSKEFNYCNRVYFDKKLNNATKADKAVIEKYIEEKSGGTKQTIWVNLDYERDFTNGSGYIYFNIVHMFASDDVICMDVFIQTEQYAGKGYYVYFEKQDGKWVYNQKVETGLVS